MDFGSAHHFLEFGVEVEVIRTALSQDFNQSFVLLVLSSVDVKSSKLSVGREAKLEIFFFSLSILFWVWDFLGSWQISEYNMWETS
jgi:hypothetical protein